MSTPEILIPPEHHALLTKQGMGVLTTIRTDGALSTNPVGFLWDGECIRISTIKTRVKYQSILNDPRIAFCVQLFKNPMDYIEIRGTASVEDDPDRAFLRKQFLAGTGEEPPEDMDPPGTERVVITLHPHKVSAPRMYGGRFDR